MIVQAGYSCFIGWLLELKLGSSVHEGLTETVSTAAFIGSAAQYPHLKDQQPDLYRAFIEKVWKNGNTRGVSSLIHPESHFTERRANSLRRECYLRLQRHFQFTNELKLFDIDNHVTFGVNVYGPRTTNVFFINASSIYHPKVIVDSLFHDGSGPPPGFKDDDHKWDLRPHRDRIVDVNNKLLETWHAILEDEDTDVLDTRMVYSVNSEAARVLAKLADSPRIRELNLQYSRGWDESIDKKKGYFDTGWAHPTCWADVILQGPHLGVATPMIKEPNKTMKSNKDWIEIDLESLDIQYVPATSYQANQAVVKNYAIDYGTWSYNGKNILVQSADRVGWRKMAAITGYRTLYPSVIPAGFCHIDGIESAGPIFDLSTLPSLASMSSLLYDFMVRSTGIANLRGETINRLPKIKLGDPADRIALLFLQLNCLTAAYASLWETVTGSPWTSDIPIRKHEERRAAQIEIDVIVAQCLGVTIDELCGIYRTQFPVMRKYDMQDRYDTNGRKVPPEVSGRDQGSDMQDLSWTHPQSGFRYSFQKPFRILDRESDMRLAYKATQYLFS